MKSTQSRLLLLAAGLLVVVGLPLAGKWARRHAGSRCELDGLKLEALYQVRVVDRASGSHRFCCIHCALLWTARQEERPEAVYVADETDGGEIDSRETYFVQSAVVTNPVTGNTIHAFRHQEDAAAHARAFRGWPLTGAERPFGEPEGSSDL